ncbi:MAG: hypothetical protein AAGF99_14150 [Bacteroidota bacterium]
MVYARRAERDSTRALVPRLLVRSAQCYLGYLVVMTARVHTGGMTATEGTWAMLLMGNVFFGNILKFYAVALLLVVPLLSLRLRHGVGSVLAAGGLTWCTATVLGGLPPPPLPWGQFVQFIAGFGGVGAPSLMHGLVLVSLGMVLGRSLRGNVPRGDTQTAIAPFRRRLLVVVAGAGAVCLGVAVAWGPREALSAHVYGTLRSLNHVGYFAAGALTASAILLACSRYDSARLSPMLALMLSPLLALGRHALFSFTAGNVLLIVGAQMFAPSSLAGTMAMVLLYLGAVVAMTQAYSRAQPRVRENWTAAVDGARNVPALSALMRLRPGETGR